MSVDPASREELEFDYIVVGSGAGGGPLAARLAREGKRVLVIEAGSNPADLAPTAGPREVSAIPSFNGLASEHPDLSWEFFVKHYTNPPPNPDSGEPSDPKWHTPTGAYEGDPEKTGIFYPRAAALGGCTIHNAMIAICGPDSDWDDLADFVRDDSWRAETMRPYFERIERNQYFRQSEPPRTVWGRIWDNIGWLFWREPDYTNGRHGYKGWLRTSVADLSIGLKDFQLIKMLKAALWQANQAGIDRFATFVHHFLRGGVRRTRETLDPNHARTQAESPEGLALIPLAVCGENGLPDEDGNPSLSMHGHRSGPREFLLEVQAEHPDKLFIETNCFVTEILFDEGPTLRAIGVKYLRGEKLYHAHRTYNPSPPTETDEFRVKKGGEVILCGGSFNTPQLLMLSGIGDKEQLERRGIECRVNSPGVGRNLHDRYEVTVISEMESDFVLLEGAEFRLPADGVGPDPFLEQWRQQGTGLYSSNGSVLGILKRSRPDLDQPDLFIFGIPLSFKGYQPGYSKDPAHNYFTWAILKAHTRNRDGTVELRSSNPLETPEINFHYFEEESGDVGNDEADDLLAILDGVKFVRGIAKHAHLVVKREAHPGNIAPADDDLAIKDWIRRESWGHHACGTCRMGPAEDENAVLDSRFRVLGEARGEDRVRPIVGGLRVVDASIFPKIPGYFIVTNVYMSSEKAAEVILEDARSSALTHSETYPDEFRDYEADAIRTRRKEVNKDPSYPDAVSPNPLDDEGWSGDVTGLALSGGGIRSATFNLGLLQALAGVHCLRRIDFLSTVSGGSYIGSFLGRFFDRLRSEPFATGQRGSVHPAADRVEHELVASDSREVAWLRKNGNYIAPSGKGDVQFDLAVLVRNLLSAHFVVGTLIFALFGLANAIRYGFFDKIVAVQGFLVGKAQLPIGHLLEAGFGVFWSPWFVLFELVLLFAVLPKLIGFWMASEDTPERYQWPALLLVFIFLAVLFFLGLHDGTSWEPLFLAFSLLVAFIYVELAWRRGRYQEDAMGTGGADTQKSRTRNYLTVDLGLALTLAGMALAFALIDTAGHALHQLVAGSTSYAKAFARFGAVLVALIPVARTAASFLSKQKKPAGPPSTLGRIFKAELIAGLLALVLLAVPLVFYSFAAHAAYRGGLAVWIGVLTTVFALIVSFILSRRSALPFLNRSSLAQTYAARLARTFLGASNPLRHHPRGANVNEVTSGDDVSTIRNYSPHESGGPLHLINVTLNQTVEFNSQRGNRDRKGESMAVTSLGLSIGQRWHSLWADSTEPALRAQGPGTVASVNAEQIIITRDGQPPQAGLHQGPEQGVYRYRLIDFAAYTFPSKLPTPVVKPGQRVKGGDVLANRLHCTKSHRARMEPVGWPRGTEHPLLDENGNYAQCAETLSLRQWMAISGAAIAPGRGQETRFGTALLFGLANLRTGYWWDSSITETSRAGFPRLTFFRRLLYLLPRVFLTQALLISEWIARYPGPWERFWYLTDGGFFENLGAYELIRRRVPRIIVSDAGEDATYQFGDMANLARKVRIDFGAEITPFTQSDINVHLPISVQGLIGSLEQLKPRVAPDGNSIPTPQLGALFWVDYTTPPGKRSVLLYLKAKLTGNESPDIDYYHAAHPEFPHEATADQFFNEEQWESYRKLGELLGLGSFADPNWFWNIPV